MHGDVITVGAGPYRTVEHTAGKCTNCRCQIFSERPITRDEILDDHEALKAEIRLKDIGIGPVMCEQVVTEWNGLTATERVCLLEFGHEGQHVV